MATIKERNGSYQITVSCGYDIQGKHLRETITFTPEPGLTPKKREKAVEDFARKFEEDVKNGIALDGRKITLKAFANRWLSEYAVQKLAPKTLENYTNELNKRILPALGHMRLAELRPAVLNGFFVGMIKDGARRDGKPGGYSRATIKKTQDVLSSVLRTATECMLAMIRQYDTQCLSAAERGGNLSELFAIPAREKIGRAKGVPADQYKDAYANLLVEMEEQIAAIAEKGEKEE